MEALLLKIPSLVQWASLFLTAIVLLATLVAKVTKTEKDDEVVGKVRSLVLKVVSWLPTIGINPRTKKLEEQLKEIVGEMPEEMKKDAPVAKDS